ncbi:MAG TPA: ASCH domain-containing protein [Candidatus Paceibacterota bacterium]|nr:ASCH domain-containing protein [Candidatus Paceibacterota bacterium]
MKDTSRKSLKFREHLVPLVLSGEKNTTWRLFDDKDLGVGDVVELINWNTGEIFGRAELLEVREKRLSEIEEVDFIGQKKFESKEVMYQNYRNYYGDNVGPETIVKIIRFKLL